MNDNILEILSKIKKLETELAEAVRQKEEEYYYEIQAKKILFEKEIKRRHKQLVTNVFKYIRDAPLLTILTVPVIWFCLFPSLFMDLVVSCYQAACFPIYGIPKVKRSDYIVLDRHQLSYLNLIEKINCFYCGYVNGLIAFIREVAARTEQYWCPIKHARRTKSFHNRYYKFFDYGDATGYREAINKVRSDFKDLQ